MYERSVKSGMATRGMVTSDAGFETLIEWELKSDRFTSGEAMAEMMTTDLRDDLDKITSPVLVIGTWIGYKQYATREQVEKNFRSQYQARPLRFRPEDTARHFVMLDDPDGFFQAVDRFLGPAKR